MVESTKIATVVYMSIGLHRKTRKFRKPVLEFMIEKKLYNTTQQLFMYRLLQGSKKAAYFKLKSSSQTENEHITTARHKSSSYSNVNTNNNKDLLNIDTSVGLLTHKLQSLSEEINVSYERWPKLISLIGFKIVNHRLTRKILKMLVLIITYAKEASAW